MISRSNWHASGSRLQPGTHRGPMVPVVGSRWGQSECTATMTGLAMCLETKRAVTVTTPNPGGAGQPLRVRLNVMRHLTRLEVLAVDIQCSLLCSGGIHTMGLPKSCTPTGRPWRKNRSTSCTVTQSALGQSTPDLRRPTSAHRARGSARHAWSLNHDASTTGPSPDCQLGNRTNRGA